MSMENLKSTAAPSLTYKRPTPPSSIPLARILSVAGMFPLPARDSYRDYRDCRNTRRIQHELLQALPFYPDPDPAGRRGRIVTTDIGNGNYINEFEITARNPSPNPNHLILVHGYGAGLGFFFHNFDAASSLDNWVVHAIDLLGYGCSLRPPFIKDHDNKQKVLAWFHDSFDAWLRARRIPRDRTMVVAHSMGAYLMATFGMDRDPRFCQKLVMVSPGGVCAHPPVPVPSYFARLWERNVLPFLLVRASGALGSKLVSGWTARRFARFSPLHQHLLHRYAYAIFCAPGLGEYMLNCLLAPGAQPRHPLLGQPLPALACQWRWWYGDEDWMDASGGRAASDAINRARSGAHSSVHQIPDSGHHLYMDNPLHFNHMLQDEMRSFGGAADP